jgi:two-component system, NarL family, nitrate/nitrite response regulator NarL
MSVIRVVLVDDHAIVREGLGMLIENDEEIRVVGEAADMAQALSIIAREKPDLVLLDLDLGRESSLDRMGEIFTSFGETRVLILTGVVDEKLHERAMLGGAQGVLLKNQAGATLVRAIKKVHQGEAWINRTLTARLLSEANLKMRMKNEEQDKIVSLSLRERQIIKLIAQGLVNKEIARRLFVSEKTIRNSLTVIYHKLEVASRLELAIYASRQGLDN